MMKHTCANYRVFLVQKLQIIKRLLLKDEWRDIIFKRKFSILKEEAMAGIKRSLINFFY